MKIPFNKKWLLIEREDYANYLFIVATWQGFTVIPKKWGFESSGHVGAEYINSACRLFILKEDFDKANTENFKSLFISPKKWDKLHKLHKKNTARLLKLNNQLKKLDVKKLSNKELLNWINKFQKGQANVHIPRGPMWLLETPDNIVSNYLQNYLTEKAGSKKKLNNKPYQGFQTLITPLKKSIWTKEKEELARIALIKSKKQRDKRLIKHCKKYEWLEYGLQGKILDFDYFMFH